MFLPSGRVHALGGGLVIFEIQQNSDTTYRVFDWNRVGLDGKQRELHVPQSLASIDFSDFEPSLAEETWATTGAFRVRCLASDPLFKVRLWEGPAGASIAFAGSMRVLGVVAGDLKVSGGTGAESVQLGPGRFCLSAAISGIQCVVRSELARFLVAE